MTSTVFADPLATTEFTRPADDRQVARHLDGPAPLPLQGMVSIPANNTAVPEYRYDPERQIAVDPHGEPFRMGKKGKEWTSYESTHTDGDGGDNETWGWEEQ